MPSSSDITRQQYLYDIAAFCQKLDEALHAAGLSPEQSLEAFHREVSAECARCSIQVSGEELYALSQPPDAERATAKIGRLRLGDCARKDCSGCYYQFRFAHQPEHDWAKLLADVDTLIDLQSRPQKISNRPKWHLSPLLHSPLLLRIGMAVAAIIGLLLVHQWRQGGRIPFLREPERFHVDTIPLEQQSGAATLP